MAITVYTYNDKVLKNVSTGKWLKEKFVLPPTNHTGTFDLCGRDSVSGAAEVAQIPNDWK